MIFFFLLCAPGKPAVEINSLSLSSFPNLSTYSNPIRSTFFLIFFFSALFSFGRDSNKTEPPDGDVCFYRMMNLLVFLSIPSVLPFLYPPYITFVALDK